MSQMIRHLKMKHKRKKSRMKKRISSRVKVQNHYNKRARNHLEFQMMTDNVVLKQHLPANNQLKNVQSQNQYAAVNLQNQSHHADAKTTTVWLSLRNTSRALTVSKDPQPSFDLQTCLLRVQLGTCTQTLTLSWWQRLIWIQITQQKLDLSVRRQKRQARAMINNSLFRLRSLHNNL